MSDIPFPKGPPKPKRRDRSKLSGPQFKKKKKIRAENLERRAQKIEYGVLNKMFIRSDLPASVRPRCECGAISKLCDPKRLCPATEVHHRKGKKGEMLNDMRYWARMNRPGHDLIHKYPELAYECGLLLHQNHVEARDEEGRPVIPPINVTPEIRQRFLELEGNKDEG